MGKFWMKTLLKKVILLEFGNFLSIINYDSFAVIFYRKCMKLICRFRYFLWFYFFSTLITLLEFVSEVRNSS